LATPVHSIAVPQSDSVRVVLQRVSNAGVTVEGSVIAEIGRGLCLLAGAAAGDDAAVVQAAVEKISGLRVFPDDAGKMNRSVMDVSGEILVVSQFTLLGDARRGRRPSFTGAASPDVARPLIDDLVSGFESLGIPTSRGEFGAMMEVSLVNDGPVTLVLDFEPSTRR